MYLNFRRRHSLICLMLFLKLLVLVNCNATESQDTLMSTLNPTNASSHKEEETRPVPLTSPPTLSLLTTWEMQTVSGVAWHPTNYVIAIAGWDTHHVGGIRLYDAQTGHELWFKEGISRGVAFTPDGNWIATTPFYEAYVQMLRVEDGRAVSSIDDNNCSAGHWLLFNTAGDTLLTGLGSGHINWETTLNLWNVQTGRCQKLEKRTGFLNFLDVNDDFSLAIVSIMMEERQVFIWDLEKETDVCNFPGDFGLFVPFEDQFVISRAESLSFYDGSSCQIIQELMIDSHPFRGYIDFSPDSKIFATAGEYLQLWDTSTGELLFQEKMSQKFFGSSSHPSLIFSPDGQYLLAVFSNLGDDGEINSTIQVWQVLANP